MASIVYVPLTNSNAAVCIHCQVHQLKNELKKHGHAVPEQEDMNDEEYEALLKQQIETKIPLADLSAYRNIWDFICSALAECQLSVITVRINTTFYLMCFWSEYDEKLAVLFLFVIIAVIIAINSCFFVFD